MKHEKLFQTTMNNLKEFFSILDESPKDSLTNYEKRLAGEILLDAAEFCSDKGFIESYGVVDIGNIDNYLDGIVYEHVNEWE